MTDTILIASIKGGAGKTTVADELVTDLNRHGVPTGLVNLDNQGGLVNEPVTDTAGLDVLVVDTPGSLSRDTERWLASADVVLVVARPSPRDVPATSQLISLLPGSCNWGLVVNEVVPGEVASRAFLETVAEQGWPVVGELPRSALFVRCVLAGETVTTYAARSSPAKAVNELTQNVLKMIGATPQCQA